MQQDDAYKESVLPPNVTARVSVEMAATFGWETLYRQWQRTKYRYASLWSFGAIEAIY